MSRTTEVLFSFGASLAAFVIWGLLPLYWQLFAEVDPGEVLAHRVLWTAILTVLVLGLTGHFGQFLNVFRQPKQLGAGLLASVLISGNGLTFIWAVAHDRMTEVSLGYYINPLLNMVLGFVILGERPNWLQTIGIILAGLGVGYLTVSAGALPWPSFILAACFGFYGLVRKTAPLPPLVGLSVEMTIAMPTAVLYLLLGPEVPGGIARSADVGMLLLLVMSGVASALPLWLFSTGARRLAYTTVGVLMFTAPSLQLALAVWVNHEPFGPIRQITFACIWTAIALYLVGMFVRVPTRPRTVDSSPQRA